MKNEIIYKLHELIYNLINYLGVERIPIEFSNIIKDDSRLVLKPGIKILVNNKFKDNYFECAKAIVHEYRHWFQINWISVMDDDLSEKWGRSLEKVVSYENADLISNIEESTTYAIQDIEIDAFAFTKYYLEKYEEMDVIHPNIQYEELIRKYIKHNIKIM